ncbi:MAG: YolD-like family protein [Lachnospiraceae bacterium]|nr:YolD-like family protein [Lachnospiraceae bacterium]
MGSKPRIKMSLENRAKQFAPFAAIRGLSEAMEKKEKIYVEKIILSPEMEEELDRKMHQVKPGEMATVVYFCKGEYLKKTGLVARIDVNARQIQIVDEKISFNDLLDIILTPN